MTTRQSLHTLIDALPECDLGMVQALIEWRHQLRDDPTLLLLATIPADDEPETDEEAAAVAEAHADRAAGRMYSHTEIVNEFLPKP